MTSRQGLAMFASREQLGRACPKLQNKSSTNTSHGRKRASSAFEIHSTEPRLAVLCSVPEHQQTIGSSWGEKGFAVSAHFRAGCSPRHTFSVLCDTVEGMPSWVGPSRGDPDSCPSKSAPPLALVRANRRHCVQLNNAGTGVGRRLVREKLATMVVGERGQERRPRERRKRDQQDRDYA